MGGKHVAVTLGVGLQRILSDFGLSVPSCVARRIAPATLRQASYGTIKIGTYQSLKRAFVGCPEGEPGALLRVGAGSGSFMFLLKWLRVGVSSAPL